MKITVTRNSGTENAIKSHSILPSETEDFLKSMCSKKGIIYTKEFEAAQLKILREKILDNSTFHCPIDDEFLLPFLREQNFKINDAHEKIKSYCWIKTNENQNLFKISSPNFFESSDYIMDKDPESLCIAEFFDGNKFPHPIKIFKGGRLKDSTSKIFFEQMSYLMCESSFFNPVNSIKGVIAIIDCEGIGMKHFKFISKNSKWFRLMVTLDSYYPIKAFQVIAVNVNPIVLSIYSMAKVFLKKKIKERISLHENIDIIKSKFPIELLPDCYGGLNGTFDEMAQKNLKAIKDQKKNLRGIDLFVESTT